MFKKYFLVDEFELERIKESPRPALSYSEIYTSVVNCQKPSKLKIKVWLKDAAHFA